MPRILLLITMIWSLSQTLLLIPDQVISTSDGSTNIVFDLNIRILNDTAFVSLNDYADGFLYDMKYASADNFLKQQVYSCSDCVIRKEVADALIACNKEFLEKHDLRIKLFDCYRPLSVQKQMWSIFPDGRYVANPYKSGSIHNRGGAVDITLVDLQSKELDMGTSFDHFGEEAHHAFQNLPQTVLANRKLLKGVMENHGFKAIRTEWWHYNYRGARSYPLSDFKTDCQ
ncbi:MAG: M15 family metallopeptidase [Bacteroidota bacterium]